MKKIILLLTIMILPSVVFATSTYYTYGNAPMMHGTFNAIAMIFNSSSFGKAVEAIFGMSFAASIAISVFGKRYDFAKYGVITLFMLSLFFWQKDTVIIEDVTLGDVYVVDDVPYGYAFTGELISSFGYYITEAMDQAYAVPTTTLLFGKNNGIDANMGYSNSGFGGPYRSLKSVFSFEFPLSNNIMIQEYVSKCLKYELMALTADEIATLKENPELMQNLPLPDGLKSTFNVPVTIAGKSGTCDTFFATYIQPDINTTMTGIINKMYGETKLTNYITSLSSSVAGFFNYSYTLNDALIQSALNKSVVKGMADSIYPDDKTAYNSFIAQFGIAQMQQQGQVLSNFGNEIMPVMKNVMEVLLFGVLPITLLLFILPGSTKMIGAYMQSLVWIQLWNPILAILNYVIVMSGVWKMTLMQEIGNVAPGINMQAMSSAVDFTDSYIGVAGYLMMSVPVLATVVLNGGKWAAGNIAGGVMGAGMMAAGMSTSPTAMQNMSSTMGISDKIKELNESGVDDYTIQHQQQVAAGVNFEKLGSGGVAVQKAVQESGMSSQKYHALNFGASEMSSHVAGLANQKNMDAFGGFSTTADRLSNNKSFNDQAGAMTTEGLVQNGHKPSDIADADVFNKESDMSKVENHKKLGTTPDDIGANAAYNTKVQTTASQHEIDVLGDGDAQAAAEMKGNVMGSESAARARAAEVAKSLSGGDMDRQMLNEKLSQIKYSGDDGKVHSAALDANGDVIFKETTSGNKETIYDNAKILEGGTKTDVSDVVTVGQSKHNLTYNYKDTGNNVDFGQNSAMNMGKSEAGRKNLEELASGYVSQGEEGVDRFLTTLSSNLSESLSTFGTKQLNENLGTQFGVGVNMTAQGKFFGNGVGAKVDYNGTGSEVYTDSKNVVANQLYNNFREEYEEGKKLGLTDKEIASNIANKVGGIYDSMREEFAEGDPVSESGFGQVVETLGNVKDSAEQLYNKGTKYVQNLTGKSDTPTNPEIKSESNDAFSGNKVAELRAKHTGNIAGPTTIGGVERELAGWGSQPTKK
jgi:hypothetical protein